MKHLTLFLFLAGSLICKTAFGQESNYSVLKNFNETGGQATRFDLSMAAIDAHDGEIALFDGIYYLYGTSYDCGYEWQTPGAPFCGFKSYSSRDLVNWTDEGFLFDAQNEIWQTRCDGKTYGCYRPHVIYNKKNNLYVLWINVYDNRVGFRVFTSPSPTGPFTEVAEPTLAVNSNSPVAGLNNGDHDLFVDEDNIAYLAYTDWRTGGTIVIDQLDENYTSGTGKHVKAVTSGRTEAPCLTRRNNIYYILYSDPNCGYCTTGTSYKTSSSPLGPWSEGIKITDNSCGGQPSFVSIFKLEKETVYLYGSDLWNNGAKNEALANYFWAPLTFDDNGAINPIICQNATVPIDPYKGDDSKMVAIATLEQKLDFVTQGVEYTLKGGKLNLEQLDCSSGVDGFTSYSDIRDNIHRGQSFVATRTGILSTISFVSSKSGHPDAGLTIEVYKANDAFQPVGKALSSNIVSVDSMGWAPRLMAVQPNIQVEAGTRYTIIMKTESTKGSYGFQYSDSAPYAGGGAIYSSNKGVNFTIEANRTLMFQTFVQPKLKY